MAATAQQETPTFDAWATAATWQAFVDRVHAVADEARLHVDPDGIRTMAVDPANVAMVDCQLSGTAFESFTVDAELTIGVNLGRLDDILGLADSDELVRIASDPDDKKLHIDVGSIEYTLATIEPDSIREEPDIPELDLPAHPVLTGAQLDRAVTAGDIVYAQSSHGGSSETIALGFDLDEEIAYASAQGDTDDVRIEWDREEMGDGARADDHAHTLVSLDYMGDVVGVLDDGEVSVDVGEEFPVHFEQAFADGNGEVEFLIAPRMATDGGRP